MNFAQACGVVTCAVTAFVGCGVDRETDVGAEHDSSSSDDDHLVASPGGATPPRGGAAESTATQAVGGIEPMTWACQATIAGPSSGLVGATLHYTANPACSPGTPEVQWFHRVGTAAFIQVRAYNTTPSLDYVPTELGTHQFVARVRAVGTTQTSLSNFLTVSVAQPPPITVADALTVAEDGTGSVDVLANDSDPNAETLTATLVSGPSAGTATITAGVISYTPAANYHGSDSITYLADGGRGATATGTLTITVTPVNDPPVAAADALATSEDVGAELDVAVNDSDLDGDALAITAVTAPAHGAATFVGTTIRYAPAANYHGGDTLTYTISDGQGGSATAALTITVTAVNDPPIAVNNFAMVTEDFLATINVVANDTDADGDTLSIASVTQPAHGAVTILDTRRVSYQPALDHNGADAFTYTVSDGHGGTATATVSVLVTSVDDPPVTVGDAASVTEDGSVTFDVVANDSDVDEGDELTLSSVTTPAHGTATVTSEHLVTYTPAANYHGADTFSYTVVDGSGAPGTATVTITVTPVNDAPLADADTGTLDEDGSATIDVVANDFDVDGDPLTITAVTQPAHGLASIADDHRVTYTPAPDYHGPDALTYTISDGAGGTATATLALTVTDVNDAPAAVADAASLAEDVATTNDVVANDSDLDGDALAVISVTAPEHGAAVIAGPHDVTYTPAANYHGSDSFTYTISDGVGGTATATVAITVTPVNDEPVAVADALGATEDSAATLDVVANDTDLDGDVLAVASVTAPAHGSASFDGSQVTYTPAANYHGGDSFTYAVTDGAGGTATATVTVTVASVNDAPVAASVAVSTFDDTPVVAVLSGSDLDGDALSFAIAAAPAHGTLGTIAGGGVTYTPALGFTGSDSFTYVASDGALSSAPSTVSITVIQSVCGNAVAEGVHEECDDGNATPSDGCEAACTLTCGSGTGADRATVDAASGHCFAAYDGVQHSYQQAAALCASIGGHLPTIGSATEDAAAFAAVASGDQPWLGADDLAIEATFGWTTGEAFAPYSDFAAGKPDDAGGADCVRYLGDGTWSDASCASTTGTLCELELATTTRALATGGTGTRGVTVADFNGDGLADLAATHPASNTVGVLFGNGAGGFVLHATYATGTGPTAITQGDLDADGLLDLAIVNATASTATILRGGAGGVFTSAGTVAIAAGATAISATDLDQDGTLDLAIGATGTVQLLHGTGTGTFTALGGISLASLGVPASVAAGDFDHDGAADLVVSTSLAVLVVRGTGGGSFGSPLSLAASPSNRGVSVADLDSDGHLDLAVASGASSVTVWFGSALGAFGSPATLTTSGAPQLVVAGDFDGDSAGDLVAVTDNAATLFRGGPGRTYTQAGTVTTGGSGASAAVAAQLDSDPAADLVVANTTTSTAGVVLGGAAGLGGAHALVVGTGSTATVTADFNEDGRPDLAVIDPAASRIFVFTQTAGGALVAGATVTLSANAGSSNAVVADFNLDGHVDIAVTNTAFSSVSVVLGTGTGTFGALLNTGTGQAPKRLAVGDFNGDGKPDLAVPASLGNALTVLINTSNGRFGRVPDVALGAGSAPSATTVGDFNGDGKQDIAVALGGAASLKVLLGNGNATFVAPATLAVAAGGLAIASGDLDGDGKLDLISTSTTTNNVNVLLGTGTGTFGAATSVATGAQPTSLVAADLDGDTRLDLVAGNAGASSVVVLHNNAAGGFVPFTVALGGAPASVMAYDVDRDGHLDLAATTSSTLVTALRSAR